MSEQRWETPTEFARRLRIPLKTVSRKLHRPDCPQNYTAREGPTGRIVMLIASADLEKFMLSNPRTLRAQIILCQSCHTWHIPASKLCGSSDSTVQPSLGGDSTNSRAQSAKAATPRGVDLSPHGSARASSSVP